MDLNRREFAVGGAAVTSAVALATAGVARAADTVPWHLRTRRWSQVNFTDEDPVKFDFAFWREFWRETRTQGVLINAGGMSAFYPSTVPGHPTARTLGDRDFLGEMANICRADSLTFVARMAFRGSPEILAANPEWANVDAEGQRQSSACMNGGYMYEYSTSIVREVASRYRPDGVSASGWGQQYRLCYCNACSRLFRESTGADLPRQRDWNDPIYRAWIEWNSERVVALWDHFDQTAKAAGGPDCHWAGQLINTLTTRSLKDLSERAAIIMVDHQTAENEIGFYDNATTGKLYNGLAGWNKPVMQSTALCRPRLTACPETAWQTWMQEGIAGGFQPWWHMIGSYSEDKRRYDGIAPLMQWHEANERYLFDRTPVATIGVVFSDTNNIFYGRDDLRERVQAPFVGVTLALSRARIPFVPVHADSIDRDAANLKALVLPDLGAMTDAQIESVRRFVSRGGGLLATGNTSLYDGYGDPRSGYALADLYGADVIDAPQRLTSEPGQSAVRLQAVLQALQTSGVLFSPDFVRLMVLTPLSHLRLTPELAATTAGPHHEWEPRTPPDTTRHPVLRGLEKTDIVYFGGTLAPLRVTTAEPLLTFVPPVPVTNPEHAYFREPRTSIPGLLVNTLSNGSRIAFMPADLDRRCAHLRYSDHADLIANAARWAANDDVPLVVEGRGNLDCNLYRQPGRMILHIANLSAAVPGQFEQTLPTGPVTVSIKLDADVSTRDAKLLVLGRTVRVRFNDGWARVQIPTIESHEVLVIE